MSNAVTTGLADALNDAYEAAVILREALWRSWMIAADAHGETLTADMKAMFDEVDDLASRVDANCRALRG